jgi:hypothetical protein
VTEAIGELLQETGARLTRAVRFAFADRAWPQRYGLAAAVLLIPVAGALALLGWQRRVFEGIRRGGPPQLPRLELKRDLRLGLPTFVNLLLFFGVPLLLARLTSPRQIFARGAGCRVAATATVLSILVFVVFPELLRRVCTSGEHVALLRPRPSLLVVRRRPAAYIVTVLAMFAAWLVMALGATMSWGLGLLVAAPPAHVIAAHLMTEWQHDVEASAPPPP